MAKKKRLKIILDTNWYVSASINRSSRRRLYDLLINENLTVFYSKELLDEFESVIFRKKFEKYIRPEQASRFIGLALTRLKPFEIKTPCPVEQRRQRQFPVIDVYRLRYRLPGDRRP